LHAAHRINKRIILLALSIASVVLLAACEPGDPWRGPSVYPIDIFPEMHYQQSFQPQEPSRLLPPEGSVPVRGSNLPLPPSRGEAAPLANPEPNDQATLERAARLYQINCSMCHGSTGEQPGVVGAKFIAYNVTQPPALSSERIQSLAPGEKMWSITNGFGFMPPFGNLLSDQDRWAIVHLLELPADQRAALLEQNPAPGGMPRE
jgi:mono/diheme cytochrome c family protein